jgi:hypothetical protein
MTQVRNEGRPGFVTKQTRMPFIVFASSDYPHACGRFPRRVVLNDVYEMV